MDTFKMIVLSLHVQHKVKFWKIVYTNNHLPWDLVIFQTSQEIISLWGNKGRICLHMCTYKKKNIKN